jgi:hypothetical protein
MRVDEVVDVAVVHTFQVRDHEIAHTVRIELIRPGSEFLEVDIQR